MSKLQYLKKYKGIIFIYTIEYSLYEVEVKKKSKDSYKKKRIELVNGVDTGRLNDFVGLFYIL